MCYHCCNSSISSSDFFFFLDLWCYTFLFLEVSWGRRLNEDLATLAKVQPFPLDRKQQARKSPNDDRFPDSKSAEESQERSGGRSDFLQVRLFSKHFQRRPDAEAELELLPPTPDGKEPPAVSGWLGCPCQEGLIARSCEMQLCKGGWFTSPPSQALCGETVSHALSKSWLPFSPCAICLIPVLLSSWRHLGFSFEELLGTKTLRVHWAVVVGCCWPPSMPRLPQPDPRDSGGLALLCWCLQCCTGEQVGRHG